MSVDLRLPNINGDTPEEQINQMRSYMYQLVSQLTWALDSIANGTLKDETPSEAEFAAKLEEVKEPNTQEAQESFNQIKALIIKSADIVDSYQEKMELTFDGRYASESDYGDFKESTLDQLAIDDTRIVQNLQSTQVLTTNVTGLEERVSTAENTISPISTNNESTFIRKANAYITTGLLGDDEYGRPLYGVEVGRTIEEDGQGASSGFSRFTHDGVYFYLPNVSEPVAFIKDFFMQVESARFPKDIAIRGYSLDTSLGGIAFRWTGDSQ